MLGGIVKGIGSALGGTVKGIAGVTADTAGLSNFTSALGDEKKSIDKPKAAKPKAFDEDEAPTKVLQRILGEVQSIHKVMASQVVPPSEEEELERDEDKKDDEVLDAIGNIIPKDKKKKKEPWWKRLWAWIKPFISWITKPLSWIKSLLNIPFIVGLVTFASAVMAFFLFNPVGLALLTIGIIAINWKDIKKAIKGYVNTVKGWIRTALKAMFLGSVADKMFGPEVETDEEKAIRLAEERAALESQLDQMMDDDRPETTVPSEGLTPVIDDDGDGIPDVPSEWVDPEKVPEAPEAFADPSVLDDAATGATIVGPDNPVTVTPKDAGTDIGPIVSQSALEAAAEAETVPPSDQIFRGVSEARAYAEERGLTDYRLEAVIDPDFEEPTGEYRIKYAGQMKTGGNIPPDSEALVHAGETVRGQGESKGGIVQSDGLVPGPATVTRAKPDKPLSKYDMQDVRGRRAFYKDGTWPEWLSAWGPQGKEWLTDRFSTEKLDARDWNKDRTENIAEYSQLAKDMSPKQAKRLMRDKNATVEQGKAKAKYLADDWKASPPLKLPEHPQNETKRSWLNFVYGTTISAKDQMSQKYIEHDGQMQEGSFESLTSWIKETDALGDVTEMTRGFSKVWTPSIDEYMGDSSGWKKTRINELVRTSYLDTMIGSAGKGPDATLQQAGQQSTVTVMNQTSVTNASSASSSSNQSNVGQTQQSIPISNTHGAAPRSV